MIVAPSTTLVASVRSTFSPLGFGPPSPRDIIDPGTQPAQSNHFDPRLVQRSHTKDAGTFRVVPADPDRRRNQPPRAPPRAVGAVCHARRRDHGDLAPRPVDRGRRGPAGREARTRGTAHPSRAAPGPA